MHEQDAQPELHDHQLAPHWLASVRRPEILADLESVYEGLAAAIAARGPKCWTSGKCCNFDAYGHKLYVTGLETAYTIERLSAPSTASAPPDESSAAATAPRWRDGILRQSDIDDALARGGCPFQSGSLCGVHAIRPLGCRVYFCDPTAQGWQQDVYEKLLKDLRALHDRHGIEYRYGEWRQMLARFASAEPRAHVLAAPPAAPQADQSHDSERRRTDFDIITGRYRVE
ncbi:MAG: YkgJ family cysteine cluster protein [Phycisphaerales bacterium]|nr:YkgJ family cysteine cluster protein [Phycisphaerales bacterium]